MNADNVVTEREAVARERAAARRGASAVLRHFSDCEDRAGDYARYLWEAAPSPGDVARRLYPTEEVAE